MNEDTEEQALNKLILDRLKLLEDLITDLKSKTPYNVNMTQHEKAMKETIGLIRRDLPQATRNLIEKAKNAAMDAIYLTLHD